MAGTPDDSGPAPSPAYPEDNQLHPALAALQSAAPDDGPAGQWTDQAVAKIQQHVNLINISDANQLAGQRFVQDLATTKDNLVGIAKADPTSAHFAIDLTPDLMGPMLAGTGLKDDQLDQAHSDITSHVQQEIARAAVTRMAEIHTDGAKSLLGSLSGHLAEGDADVLGRYIDLNDQARTADHAATLEQQASDRARDSSLSAYDFGSKLLDPRTETVNFPHNFMQGLVQNEQMTTADKAGLSTAYNNLRAYGDADSSNPHIVAQLLSDISDPSTDVAHGDIAAHVGTNLKYVDAQMLHGLNTVRTPEALANVQALSSVVNGARQQLAGSGDAAGDAAFGRFTDWLLPSYRRTGAAGLNPASDNYLFANNEMGSFAPKHEDVVQSVPVPDRPSLHSIFAGDIEPLRPLNSNPQSVAPFGVPGETGNLLRQMIGPAYTTPKPPVRFFAEPGKPANEAMNNGPGGTENG